MNAIIVPLILVALVMLVYGLAKRLTSSTNTPAQPIKQRQRPLTPEEREALRQAERAFDWHTANSILKREYTGTLPECIVGGLWTNLYPNLYQTSIAGINFRKGIKDLAGLYFDAILVADPKNKFDAKAIKIVHAGDGRHLGFIPAEETDDVRAFVNNQLPYSAVRAHIDEGEDEDFDTGRTRHFLIGEINIKKPENPQK